MAYRKLKKKDITINVEECKDGTLLLSVGMYEKDNWKQYIGVRLINFPEQCESMDDFKNFIIKGVKES